MAGFHSKADRSVSAWLLVLIIMVMAMVLLGGATRLTNSGLSITEWRPISGALPPLSNADWLSEFAKYQKIPEFSVENPDMDLAAFKFIYFMEWSHRQLGRLIGLVCLLPLLYFLIKGRLRSGEVGRFVLIFVLGGIQAGIGWWMVHSGLGNNRVDVAPYRLAIHLGGAFVILGVLLWTWLDVRQGWPARATKTRLRKSGLVLLVLVFLQILAGAIVAGTHSGLSYNTWPLMDGGIVPGGYLMLSPLWKNIFENTAAIQFHHRMLAYLVALWAVYVFVRARKSHNRDVRRASWFVLVAICLQIMLGIITLLKVVPIHWALAHQAGALFVFVSAVWLVRATRVRAY